MDFGNIEIFSCEEEGTHMEQWPDLVLLVLLLAGKKVGPVKKVEHGEDAGEENSGEDVDLLGSELEIYEPCGNSIGWQPVICVG
jgi:hypothetical protein